MKYGVNYQSFINEPILSSFEFRALGNINLHNPQSHSLAMSKTDRQSIKVTVGCHCNKCFQSHKAMDDDRHLRNSSLKSDLNCFTLKLWQLHVDHKSIKFKWYVFVSIILLSIYYQFLSALCALIVLAKYISYVPHQS